MHSGVSSIGRYDGEAVELTARRGKSAEGQS